MIKSSSKMQRTQVGHICSEVGQCGAVLLKFGYWILLKI